MGHHHHHHHHHPHHHHQHHHHLHHRDTDGTPTGHQRDTGGTPRGTGRRGKVISSGRASATRDTSGTPAGHRAAPAAGAGSFGPAAPQPQETFSRPPTQHARTRNRNRFPGRGALRSTWRWR